MFSADDMERFVLEAWGKRGRGIVERWRFYNDQYFGGALRPIPIVITNTLPFGRILAFCAYSGAGNDFGRRIVLNVPRDHDRLVADNGVLLHEMIHQFLQERGEDASHKEAPWRRELMRLHQALTGKTIWAGHRTSKRVRGRDGSRVSVKLQAPGPESEPSLTQLQIACWPCGHGIDLDRLGASS
jgi:hypothetical protein